MGHFFVRAFELKGPCDEVVVLLTRWGRNNIVAAHVRDKPGEAWQCLTPAQLAFYMKLKGIEP